MSTMRPPGAAAATSASTYAPADEVEHDIDAAAGHAGDLGRSSAATSSDPSACVGAHDAVVEAERLASLELVGGSRRCR